MVTFILMRQTNKERIMKLVLATELKPGMVLALPFQRKATIKSVKIGRLYVTLWFEEWPKSRVEVHQEIMVETP
jgi:hypothetical protein